MAKHKLDFSFWPMKLQLIPWLRYFAIWVFIVGFREGQGGWMLFGITINEFGAIREEKATFILTLLGHNFRFGVKPYVADILHWRLK